MGYIVYGGRVIFASLFRCTNVDNTLRIYKHLHLIFSNIAQRFGIQVNKIVSFCNMKVHIGREIKQVVDKKGWSIVNFAKQAGMSYRTALYLFERSDISVDQLLHIGKILEHDFMQLFRSEAQSVQTMQEDGALHKKDFITMNFSLHIGGRQASYEMFPELIKKTRRYAEELGFQLL